LSQLVSKRLTLTLFLQEFLNNFTLDQLSVLTRSVHLETEDRLKIQIFRFVRHSNTVLYDSPLDVVGYSIDTIIANAIILM